MDQSRHAHPAPLPSPVAQYDHLQRTLADLIQEGQRASARAVNAVMTATYWLVGRHLVEFEQGAEDRAAFGARVIERLAADLDGGARPRLLGGEPLPDAPILLCAGP